LVPGLRGLGVTGGYGVSRGFTGLPTDTHTHTYKETQRHTHSYSLLAVASTELLEAGAAWENGVRALHLSIEHCTAPKRGDGREERDEKERGTDRPESRG
jgi:hypothetical protein